MLVWHRQASSNATLFARSLYSADRLQQPPSVTHVLPPCTATRDRTRLGRGEPTARNVAAWSHRHQIQCLFTSHHPASTHCPLIAD